MGAYSLRGKVVLITGASSGFGEATAWAFARQGSKLVLAARRKERLERLAADIEREHAVKSHVVRLDVRDREDVFDAVASLPEEFANVDVLVNNAGLSLGLDKFHECNVDDWDIMVDTNLKGLLYVTRAVLPGMVQRGSGHVIHVASISGHDAYPGGNVYCATKAAVQMLTRCMRLDLVGTPIRVSCINPGMANTEFGKVRFHGDQERADRTYDGIQPLRSEDVADAIVYCAAAPPDVNVETLTVLTQAQVTPMVSYREKK